MAQANVRVCTVEDVRAAFRERGISVTEWALQRGVSPQLTYQILAGRKIGLRGQSHEISVLLGLKPGAVSSAKDLNFSHDPTTREEDSVPSRSDRRA
jgi:gp16 family phage-associated protein